jgi:hypothetical protein
MEEQLLSFWKEEEDNKVVDHVFCFGTTKWAVLPGQLPGRSYHQVRNRWVQQLDPSINKNINKQP